MRKNIAYLIIIIAALVVQTSIFPAVFSHRPLSQIMLMLVIAWTINSGFKQVLPWIILAGALLDFVSYTLAGSSIILFVLVAYFISFFSRRFLVESRGWGSLVILFFIIIITVAHRFFMLFISVIENGLDYGRLNYHLLTDNLAVGIVFNMLLFFLCFYLLKKVEKSRFLLSPSPLR